MTLAIGDHLVIYRQHGSWKDGIYIKEGEFKKVEGEAYHEYEVISYTPTVNGYTVELKVVE